MVFLLNNSNYNFPDPALANKDGLLAVGGNLSAEGLMMAYNQGIFPWYIEGENIHWYAPHERCVLFPENIIVGKTMKKILSKNTFEVTTNKSFETVIENCSNIKRKDGHGTWITDEMKDAYINLHKHGHAHSIEVWKDKELAGGMYGVVINNIFCGESMFSKITNASKIAMIWLCQSSAYKFLDCQVPNDHLLRMGATIISQQKYLALLKSDKVVF